MRKKIYEESLEKEILSMLSEKRKFLSIREITKELNQRGVKKSPQVVKRHLISLLKQKKIIVKNGKTAKI